MSWDAALTPQTQITITWEAWAEDGALGTVGYLPPRQVKCFVGPSSSVESGVFTEGMARRLIVIPPFDAAGAPITRMSARDRFTLPPPFDEPGAPSPTKEARPCFDEYGQLHHFEVYA